MFQSRFGKIDQFGWWDLERISADAGTQFTLTEFKEECQIRGVRLTLAATEHDDAYSKIPKLYGMENITTAEVLDKLDMFQSRFGKIDQFGWWDLERISVDAGTQFTLTEFKEECQIRGVCLTLAAPEHQEMN